MADLDALEQIESRHLSGRSDLDRSHWASLFGNEQSGTGCSIDSVSASVLPIVPHKKTLIGRW